MTQLLNGGDFHEVSICPRLQILCCGFGCVAAWWQQVFEVIYDE
jgi:hypothetical protein